MTNPNWYVLTGGPSTGKTTLQNELAKLGYATSPEPSRQVIDDAMSHGTDVLDLRDDEERFQDDVVRRRELLEKTIPTDREVILYGGMQDSLAYYRYYGFTPPAWAMSMIENATYGKVFLIEPLGIFKEDYARTEVMDFTDHITDLILEAYKEYDMEPILVPAASVEERLALILSHLRS